MAEIAPSFAVWCLNAALKRRGFPKRMGFPGVRKLAVPYTELHQAGAIVLKEAVVVGARKPSLAATFLTQETDVMAGEPLDWNPYRFLATLEGWYPSLSFSADWEKEEIGNRLLVQMKRALGEPLSQEEIDRLPAGPYRHLHQRHGKRIPWAEVEADNETGGIAMHFVVALWHGMNNTHDENLTQLTAPLIARESERYDDAYPELYYPTAQMVEAMRAHGVPIEAFWKADPASDPEKDPPPVSGTPSP